MRPFLLGFVALVAIGPILALANAKAENDCARVLSAQARIRHSDPRQNFAETKSGFYTKVGEIMVFVPDRGSAISTKVRNAAAHAEILRQKMGPERFDQIVSSSSTPEDSVEDELAEELNKIAAQEGGEDHNSPDLDLIHEEVAQYPMGQATSPETEAKVFGALKYLGRIGFYQDRFDWNLTEWLRPKVLAGNLRQIGDRTFQGDIVKRLRRDVIIYKANLMTVFLNGPREFLITSDKGAIPDMVHSQSRALMENLVPSERIQREKTQPGYIIITFDRLDSQKKGTIEFVTKSGLTPLAKETFDFEEKTKDSHESKK